jgi:hypothetical protein
MGNTIEHTPNTSTIESISTMTITTSIMPIITTKKTTINANNKCMFPYLA